MARVLAWIARQGRYALLVGLGLGMAFPGLAIAMRPTIEPLVVFLLFLAVLRLGPLGLKEGLKGAKQAVLAAIGLQMALPVGAILILGALGLLTHPVALGVVLMLSAPPITGSPHLAAMAGVDPAPALHQLVVGTLLLPLTALPVFWLIPDFGDFANVVRAVLGLLAMICLAGLLALGLGRFGVVKDTPQNKTAIDAAVAITLGAVVIGLMSAMGPALHENPVGLAMMIAVAFGVNAFLQIGAYWMARGLNRQAMAPAMGIVAGNRNIAILLGVLPTDLAATLLLFIGCYQFPMYLTPILFGRLYKQGNV